jgi:hypothetical protein
MIRGGTNIDSLSLVNASKFSFLDAASGCVCRGRGDGDNGRIHKQAPRIYEARYSQVVVEQFGRHQSKCPLNLAVLLPVAKVDAEKQLSFSMSLARMPGSIRASTSSLKTFRKPGIFLLSASGGSWAPQSLVERASSELMRTPRTRSQRLTQCVLLPPPRPPLQAKLHSSPYFRERQPLQPPANFKWKGDWSTFTPSILPCP